VKKIQLYVKNIRRTLKGLSLNPEVLFIFFSIQVLPPSRSNGLLSSLYTLAVCVRDFNGLPCFIRLPRFTRLLMLTRLLKAKFTKVDY
jgi:hypothetical protein